MSYDPIKDPLALLDDNLVAKLLHRQVSSIKRDRRNRVGIPFVKINHNTVRYRRIDVEKFLADNMVKTDSVYAPDAA